MAEPRDLVLADLAKCDRMLQTITSIEEGMKVAATIEALDTYAKKVHAGIEVQNRCTHLRAKVERRCGQLREAIGKAKGTRGQKLFPGPGRGKKGKTGGYKTEPPVSKRPTIAELKLTKKTSARMTKLAKVEEATIAKTVAEATGKGEEISLPKLVDAIAVITRKVKREATWVKAKINENIIIGDFRSEAGRIPDNSVHLILTDPPYDRKASEMLPALAAFAASKLVTGGSLLCYVGETQLPAALDAFRRSLRYWWVVACLHAGRSTVMREYGVNATWKPILWFVKGTRHDASIMIRDTVSGGEEKAEHPWQQAQAEAEYLIDKLCPVGGIVADPFLGSGTTAVAAKKLGRRWIAIEIDGETAKKASERIG